MGRVQVHLKKIENNTYRHITFAKRKTGLIKKAYELSTLCDVEVALIIFSPAGKLFIFDAKKRVEEILAQLIDHPVCERLRVGNQESIRRMVDMMSSQAGLQNRPTITTSISDRTKERDMDSQLEEIQKKILKCKAQLEDLDKQLEYFLGNPKTASEAEYHEMVLEETLKRVELRRQVLEANCGVQPASKQFGDHNISPYLISWQENPVDDANKASLTYNISGQPQDDLLSPTNFTQQNGLRPSRDLPELLVGMLPSQTTNLQGERHLTATVDELEIQPEMDGHKILGTSSGKGKKQCSAERSGEFLDYEEFVRQYFNL